MNKMSTCTERYYQGNNNNPQMQSQKQQLMTDFDNCARNNPTSPFVVMMREEGKTKDVALFSCLRYDV